MNSTDDTKFQADLTANDPLADFNFDGATDFFDYLDFTAAYSVQLGSSNGRGVLSRSAVGNRFGYAGYQWDTAIAGAAVIGGKWHVRHRVLDAERGTWLTRDPMGYHDGEDLYEYVRGRAVKGRDPSGLYWQICPGGGCIGDAPNGSQPSTGAPPTKADSPITFPYQGCQALLEEALSNQAVIDAIRIADAACPSSCGSVLDRIACNECENYPGTSAPPMMQTTYLEKCPRIQLCFNSPSFPSDINIIIGVLLHELTHVRQACEKPGKIDCGERLCREFEGYAAETSLDCHRLWARNSPSWLSCVCASACRSMPRLPGNPLIIAPCEKGSTCNQDCEAYVRSGKCKDGHFVRPAPTPVPDF